MFLLRLNEAIFGPFCKKTNRKILEQVIVKKQYWALKPKIVFTKNILIVKTTNTLFNVRCYIRRFRMQLKAFARVLWTTLIKILDVIFIIIIIIYLFTEIGLSPGGSGYFTCKQNMKLVTTKFKSGGLHEKRAVATWSLGNHHSICL
jgi:hypothetical protein